MALKIVRRFSEIRGINDLFAFEWPNAYVAFKGLSLLILAKSESNQIIKHSIQDIPSAIMTGEYDLILEKMLNKSFLAGKECSVLIEKKNCSFKNLIDESFLIKNIIHKMENM